MAPVKKQKPNKSPKANEKQNVEVKNADETVVSGQVPYSNCSLIIENVLKYVFFSKKYFYSYKRKSTKNNSSPKKMPKVLSLSNIYHTASLRSN